MTGKARLSFGVNGTNTGFKERSRSRSKRRHETMYAKTDLFDRQQNKEDRKRDETKKELKNLLTKFIGPDRAKYAVENA